MDYDEDSTDSLGFPAVATSNAALTLMMATTRSAKLAADILACTNAPKELLARFTREAVAMDWRCAERLTDMIEGYRQTGKIGAGHAAWLVGTSTHQGMRDMLFASRATTGTDHGDIGAAPMGEKTPEDWGFLKAGGDTLYAALDSSPPNTMPIPGRPWLRRAVLLIHLGLLHSIGGTMAQSLIDQPAQEMPGHPGRGERIHVATGPG